MSFEEAVAAHRAGDFATAERGYRDFLHLRSGTRNLAVLYRHLGRLAEAEALFRRIVEQFPDSADDRRALSLCLLGQRRYAEAWPLYEARRGLPDMPEPDLPFPDWRGEPLKGRRLLVVPEQGLGDQLMMGRFVPQLVARARAEGGEAIVWSQPPLTRLFQACGFATTASAPPGADAWVLMNSLPYRLGVEVPPPPGYIPAPVSAGGGGGIGVVATGNPRHVNDRNRSLDPAAAAELRALGQDLAPEATGARDLWDTAQIVADLDLVITVDTSLAHLAGAMGTPCWVLLPALGLDWRWNDGVRSAWYPQARLFRQETPGDWAGVLARVRAALG